MPSDLSRAGTRQVPSAPTPLTFDEVMDALQLIDREWTSHALGRSVATPVDQRMVASTAVDPPRFSFRQPLHLTEFLNERRGSREQAVSRPYEVRINSS